MARGEAEGPVCTYECRHRYEHSLPFIIYTCFHYTIFVHSTDQLCGYLIVAKLSYKIILVMMLIC